VGTSAIEVAYESGEVFANNTGLALNSGASWILYWLSGLSVSAAFGAHPLKFGLGELKRPHIRKLPIFQFQRVSW
jgi:hypothetical protein